MSEQIKQDVEDEVDSGEARPFDAGDERDVRKRKRETKNARFLRIETLKTIMSTPNGRQWIWWLLGETHISGTSYSDIPSRMAFMEGERNVGLKLFAELQKHCSGDYAKMVNEAQQLEETLNAPISS